MSDLPLLSILHTWYTNFTSNVANSISNLTIRDYIRLVWIIGGYLFLRPYLDKGFRKLLDRGGAHSEEETQAATLDAYGSQSHGDEGQETDEDGDSTAVPQWGKSARRKQRKFMEFLEQEAERRKEEDDDKDIADLLED